MNCINATAQLLLCLVFCIQSNSQSHTAIRVLQPGDSLPALRVSDVLNHPEGTLALSEFKGKLLILDFWNHRCASCIAAFKKLDSLQRAFDSEIQIVLVNQESKEATEAFFKKFKHIQQPAVPMITGDSILSRYFPAQYFPSHVWVDAEGIVSKITGGYNTTRENIRAFLDQRPAAIKNFTNAQILSGPHLSHLYSDWTQATLRYSSLTRCRDSVNVFNETASRYDEKLVRVSCNCASGMELFLKAFNANRNTVFGKSYNTELIGIDSLTFIRPRDPNRLDQWTSGNAFSYELMISAQQSGTLFDIMQRELQHAFDLSAYVVKKKVPGFKLTMSRGGEADQNSLDTEDNYRDFSSGKADLWQFKNLPLSSFINRLSIKLTKKGPFVWKVRDHICLSFSIPASVWASDDLTELMELLKQNNLKLIEQFIETEVLVIKKSTSE